MKVERWQVSKQVELNYMRDLLRMVEAFFTPSSAQKVRILNAGEWIDRYAWQAAQRMVTGLMIRNARTWQAASRESMRGGEIFTALRNEMRGPTGDRVRALVHENASLIKTLPYEIAEQVTRQLATHAQTGERATFEPSALLNKVARSRARLIARTETSKATTALTEARSEDLGIEWYIWQTSKDQRVRMSHRKMQGVLINWVDPPSPEKLFGEKKPPAPYQAGNIYNCRCYPEPLLRLDQISWPHKVYSSGAIRYVTLAQFKQISGRLAA